MDTLLETKKQELQTQRQVPLEAISKALYLVTDLIDKNDPIRQSLRTLSIELILSEDNGHKDLKIRQLTSLIKIAKETNAVSEMNADLLLKALITNIPKNDTDKKSIVANVLENLAEVKDEPASVSYVPEKDFSRSQIKENTQTSVLYKKNVTPVVGKKVTTVETGSQNLGSDIGSRRKRILEIVKVKGQVTINEFIDEIQGCSSKTIQRELTSLVLSGTLKKSGERRWSKYSLK